MAGRLTDCYHRPPAVPTAAAAADGSGGLTLIADLGCFTISTNTAAAGSLTAEEAALYECFVVRVDHVSAYLLDGHFAWPSNDELLEASSGRLPAAASSGAVLAAPAAAGAAAGHQASAAARAAAEQAGDSVLQQLLGRRARIVPLLYRFGLGMDLQVATSVHPRCGRSAGSCSLHSCGMLPW